VESEDEPGLQSQVHSLFHILFGLVGGDGGTRGGGHEAEEEMEDREREAVGRQVLAELGRSGASLGQVSSTNFLKFTQKNISGMQFHSRKGVLKF
jgi:hypothetical protein